MAISELKIPGTYNLVSINCQLTETHPQHEDYCERKIQVIRDTKPEPVSISANYLKKNGWPTNITPQIVEKLLPECFTNWLNYMRLEEKRVGVLFPAMVKFYFAPHTSVYLDYGWDKKWFFVESSVGLLGKDKSSSERGKTKK